MFNEDGSSSLDLHYLSMRNTLNVQNCLWMNKASLYCLFDDVLPYHVYYRRSLYEINCLFNGDSSPSVEVFFDTESYLAFTQRLAKNLNVTNTQQNVPSNLLQVHVNIQYTNSLTAV